MSSPFSELCSDKHFARAFSELPSHLHIPVVGREPQYCIFSDLYRTSPSLKTYRVFPEFRWTSPSLEISVIRHKY